MISWLLALLASSQVPYELLALFLLYFLGGGGVKIPSLHLDTGLPISPPFLIVIAQKMFIINL